MPTTTTTKPGPSAEILNWQIRIRILVASTAAVAELLVVGNTGLATAVDTRAVAVLIFATVAYVVAACATAVIVRRDVELPGWIVTTTMCSDVAFVFALTIAISPPAYYGRILILAFLALYLSTFSFGSRQAFGVLILTAVGYLTLVRLSIASGAGLAWHQELLSVGAFLGVGGLMLAEQRGLRRRLMTILRLFERAEEGDFSEAYDEDADARPDAIASVGRAYNRVRGHLASLVLTDALTGCVNRRGFDQALAREVARARRAGSELALLALDVDHFKSVNDTMGHPAGDSVLREIGALLMHEARGGDVVARTGGEEFALILPDTSGAGAYRVAARLCESLRDHRFTVGSRAVRLTVSIGVVASRGVVAGVTVETADVLKGRADEALYSAKRGGRDRVRTWAADSDRAPMAARV